MKSIKIILIAIPIIFLLANCKKEKKEIVYFSEQGVFTDNRDNKVYKWVKIGKQTWMAENLRYFSSGVKKYKLPIDSVRYGFLYWRDSVLCSCPKGWHLPDEKEWMQLINYVGGTKIAGCYLKESGIENWYGPDIGATNNTTFTALPGGYYEHFRYFSYGFVDINTGCYFWVKGQDNYYYYFVKIDYNSQSATLLKYYPDKMYCFSIRCVKD